MVSGLEEDERDPRVDELAQEGAPIGLTEAKAALVRVEEALGALRLALESEKDDDKAGEIRSRLEELSASHTLLAEMTQAAVVGAADAQAIEALAAADGAVAHLGRA